MIGVGTGRRDPIDGSQVAVRDIIEKRRLWRDDVFLPIGTLVNVLDRLVSAPNAPVTEVRRRIERPRDARVVELIAERGGIPARHFVAVRNLTLRTDLRDIVARAAGAAPVPERIVDRRLCLSRNNVLMRDEAARVE